MRLTNFGLIVILCLTLALPVQAATPIYLPLVSNQAADRPRLDLAHLGVCDYAELAKLNPNTPPDYSSTKGCLSKSVRLGFPDHSDGNITAAAPSDIFVPSVIAQHVLSCTACTISNGVTQIRANISSQKVTIPSQLWHSYFWGNMMGLRDTHTPITCQNGIGTFPTLRVGIGLGRATNDMILATDRRIYWEISGVNSCYAYTDPYNASFAITGASAPQFEIYKSGTSGNGTLWTGRVWLGTWVVLFSNVSMPINTSANGAFAGQFLSAVASDFGNITEWTNFVHKLQILSSDTAGYRSWHTYALPARLNNVATYSPAPFNVTDNVGGDWTSFSSNINQ